MSTRVVVADDSVLLREGLVRLLEESGFEVVGQAGDAEDLMRKVGAHKPDVAVVDVRMPPPWICSRSPPSARATCSRTACPTWTRSPTPSGASPTAARRWIPRSWRC